MTEETLKKFCLGLKYNLIREVNIQDFKENLYEIQKNNKYHLILNRDEKTKQEYDSMLDEFIKYLETNKMVIKNEKDFYFYDQNKIFAKTENEMNEEDRIMYLDMAKKFIELNCKKYQDETKVYTIKQKKVYFDLIQEIIELNCKQYQDAEETKVYTIKRSIRIPKDLS